MYVGVPTLFLQSLHVAQTGKGKNRWKWGAFSLGLNPRRVDGNDPGYHYPINAYDCSCSMSITLDITPCAYNAPAPAAVPNFDLVRARGVRPI